MQSLGVVPARPDLTAAERLTGRTQKNAVEPERYWFLQVKEIWVQLTRWDFTTCTVS